METGSTKKKRGRPCHPLAGADAASRLYGVEGGRRTLNNWRWQGYALHLLGADDAVASGEFPYLLGCAPDPGNPDLRIGVLRELGRLAWEACLDGDETREIARELEAAGLRTTREGVAWVRARRRLPPCEPWTASEVADALVKRFNELCRDRRFLSRGVALAGVRLFQLAVIGDDDGDG